MRGIFHGQSRLGLSARLTEKIITFLYFLSYHSYYKLHFGITMCTFKYCIELIAFHIDDKDLNTNKICEKSAQIFKMDDASVRHQPVKVVWMTYQYVIHLVKC